MALHAKKFFQYDVFLVVHVNVQEACTNGVSTVLTLNVRVPRLACNMHVRCQVDLPQVDLPQS